MLDKFHKYYLLRAMFAQVVEDLILLDRIVYLMEQVRFLSLFNFIDSSNFIFTKIVFKF